MRLSTNREQGQASLNFAERENVRPMVQQAKLWIITLLLMVVVLQNRMTMMQASVINPGDPNKPAAAPMMPDFGDNAGIDGIELW